MNTEERKQIEEYLNKKYPDGIPEIPEIDNKIREDNKKKLKESYFLIIKILNKYLDLKPEYYDIIALWIIGTYYHKSFITFPYLFLNAVKGSGKSRALKSCPSILN